MRVAVFVFAFTALVASSCQEPPTPSPEATPESDDAVEADVRALIDAEGKILSLEANSVTIDHRGIGDLWEPSQSAFSVENRSLLDGFAPGDEVRFWVLVHGDESVTIDRIEKR